MGRHISAPQDPDRKGLLIVGVVKDAKYQHLREQRSATVYLPYRQHLKRLRQMVLTVRTANVSSDPIDRRHELIPAIRRQAAILGGDVPLTFRSMTEQVNQWLVQDRLVATLSLFFAVLALLVSAIGLYGVVAYSVERRTGEIGIRMALGARRRSVTWLILRETLMMTILGVVIGLPTSIIAARLVSSMLFGLTPNDPAAISAALSLLLLVAVLAGSVPARRASRVHPMVALRYE